MHNVQRVTCQVLQSVIDDGRNLNQVLEEVTRTRGDWSSSQRGALQDLCYGSLRFYGQLDALTALLLRRPFAENERRVHYLLIVALYQLIHSKTAHHAIVDHAVRCVQKINPRLSGLVNAVLRNYLRQSTELLNKANRSPQGRYSYPAWWIGAITQYYGEQADAILQAGNSRPPMTLRINTQHTTAENYLERLSTESITATLVKPRAVKLQRPMSVDKLPDFFAGHVSVQDAGAQHAALLLDAQDGMSVLDACAAPGGKTAHILELAKVEMVALDKDEKRLQRVTENLQRLNLSATLKVGDAALPETWWDGRLFDRILADVPCSASGVVRRHPDIKWLRRPEDIANFANQQRTILQALWRMLKPQGKLLYATCSIFPQENEQLISQFLHEQTDAHRIKVEIPDADTHCAGQLLPNAEHDGFFYALLQKQ